MSDPFQEDALPPHEVFEVLGHDCMGGALNRARDPARDVYVTLQVLGHAIGTPDAKAQFIREARAFARLRLPYVLPVYAAGMYDGRPCFTTKLAPKGRLRDRLGRPTDPRAAADLVEKLARGVAAAHAHGLVHGCLCPAAVHFDENDQPLICIYDLADGCRPGSAIAEACVIGGVPAYMAPEQAADPPRVEPAADVWALGVLLYELVTGRQPFVATNTVETLRRVLSDAAVPPRRLRRDVDRELEAVVLRCLQKKPDDRYGSARALADDLERWLRAEPTAARPESWWRRFLGRMSRLLRRAVP